MSVSRCYTIHCDDCAQWVQSCEDEPLSHLRRKAARMGWTSAKREPGYRTTRNWCPRCSKKQHNTPAR